jgi:ubiquinone/menaquinone biosynthesis C-methylase UbiE
MTLLHERHVIERFDLFADRFRDSVEPEDHRVGAIVDALVIARGTRVLDLGCGKGRFARHLIARGTEVVGLDASTRMLAQGRGLDRVRGSALRLPFASGSFGGAFAVEVFEHLPRAAIPTALREMARVLAPGAQVAIVDKNALALDARRPWLPKLAVKWIDERRGLWMYEPDGPVRERWFVPSRLARLLRDAGFEDVCTRFLLAPDESRRAIFRRVPIARLMALWSARMPGEDRP